MRKVDLAVVGGGIAGLAAAWEARRRGVDVVVVDADERAGGKLRTSRVAGVALDESADAFLARVPEAVDLCTDLGLEADLVSPATGKAYIWVRDALRPLPSEQLLGVPTDLHAWAAADILSPATLSSLQQSRSGPGFGHWSAQSQGQNDPSVGEVVRGQVGDEVMENVVGPLIGGIWAGDPDRLSMATTAPAFAEALTRGEGSLLRGAALIREAATTNDTPVFLAPHGGMGRLVDCLVDQLGDHIRLGQAVDGLERTAAGRWRLDPLDVEADAVVLAIPAPTVAKLVRPHCSSHIAESIAQITYASVAMLAMAVPVAAIDRPLDGSGFLVPAHTGRLLTACSWTSSKWPHLRPDDDHVLLRASAGRDGDERALALDDEQLVAALLEDLRDTMQLHGEPTEVRISRWAGSFPQPRPGHLERLAQLQANLASQALGLAIAGAWTLGVGIPACIRSARRAVDQVLNVRTSAS